MIQGGATVHCRRLDCRNCQRDSLTCKLTNVLIDAKGCRQFDNFGRPGGPEVKIIEVTLGPEGLAEGLTKSLAAALAGAGILKQ